MLTKFCTVQMQRFIKALYDARTKTDVDNTDCIRRHNVHQTWRVPCALKGSPYSITEHRVPELILVLGSQPAGDASHKPGGRLPLLFARPAVTPATLKSYEGCYQFCCLVNRGTMGVSSLPKTVTRQRRDCDLNPGLLYPSPAC